jgi:phosphoribosyl-AMP cyclohydrolase
MSEDWLDTIRWNPDGLIPVIAQETGTGRVLMLAWMNRESLNRTLATGEAVYWSRSRQRLWHKGESSGNTQRLVQMRLDCDRDTLLLEVEQRGGIACHTGRHNCFFHRYEDGDWRVVEPVLKDPGEMYGDKT